MRNNRVTKDLRVISDGHVWLDGGGMFGVVPRVLWSRFAKPDEENRVLVGLNCLLLRIESGYALIEAGLGDVFPQEKRYAFKMSPEPRLPEVLAEANVDCGEVRWVILSHLHYDHCGWIASHDPNAPRARFVPTFPNARYVVQEGELEQAADPPPRMRASYVPNQWKTISDAMLWQPMRGSAELFDGVRVEVTGGHVPFHQITLIERDDLKVAFMADLIPSWLHLRPAWCCAYDAAPDEVVERKAGWIDRIISEGWTAALYHEPGPSLGRLSRNQDSRIEVECVEQEESGG